MHIWISCLQKKPFDWFCISLFESSFIPHCIFWALHEASLCISRLTTAAIRWQLWTFHLSAVSRRSESSVCLSKPLSVFNLNCFSGILSVAHPAALVSTRPGWIPWRCERFWWRKSLRWLGGYGSLWAFLGLQKDIYRLPGAECFRQINHLWIRSFPQPRWGESLRDILRSKGSTKINQRVSYRNIFVF